MNAGAVPAASFQPIDRAARLTGEFRRRTAVALLESAIRDEFPGRVAVVSSFGTESAVILAMVADIDPTTPVMFLETGKHFPESLSYRDRLAGELGLTDLRNLAPEPDDLAATDPSGELWRVDADGCCALRKVRPLERALHGFDAWITGRKRYHGGARHELPAIEVADGRVKLNPLADWSAGDIAAEFRRRRLPVHPLVAAGYASIGCAPCTRPTVEGEPARAGRWADSGKTECGIHRAPWAGSC